MVLVYEEIEEELPSWRPGGFQACVKLHDLEAPWGLEIWGDTNPLLQKSMTGTDLVDLITMWEDVHNFFLPQQLLDLCTASHLK